MNYNDPTYLEAVHAALFNLVENAVFAGGLELNLTTRALMVPDQVPVANQPALIQVEGAHRVTQGNPDGVLGVAKWEIGVVEAIFIRGEGTAAPNQSPLAATTANYIIWGIANVFETKPPYGKQTLGGLVVNAWIDGEVTLDIGSEQVLITVPIHILLGPGT